MAVFTMPVSYEVPGLPVDASPIQRSMFRWKGPEPRGRNVWIYTDGTASETDPTTTYNADGSIATFANDRVARFLQGGVSHTVTAAEASILTASGFGAYLS